MHMGFELRAVCVGVAQLHANQFKQKIQMPPCAAKFAIAHRGQADGFLFFNDFVDFGIFHRVHGFHAAFAAGALAAGLFQGFGAQKAADDVKTIGGAVA